MQSGGPITFLTRRRSGADAATIAIDAIARIESDNRQRGRIWPKNFVLCLVRKRSGIDHRKPMFCIVVDAFHRELLSALFPFGKSQDDESKREKCKKVVDTYRSLRCRCSPAFILSFDPKDVVD